MSEPHHHHSVPGATAPDRGSAADTNGAADDRVRYPTNSVIGVLDTDAEAGAALHALTGGGFLESEVHLACGTDAADRIAASTGRSGLAGLATRLAQLIGVQNDEMTFKAHYETALREGRVVVLVEAPTEERKARAAELLESAGAHAVSFHGRFTIEGLVPPRAD